jgi:hypothetical protein
MKLLSASNVILWMLFIWAVMTISILAVDAATSPIDPDGTIPLQLQVYNDKLPQPIVKNAVSIQVGKDTDIFLTPGQTWSKVISPYPNYPNGIELTITCKPL